MKTTGMIRRIDELGRIVIPKEIRSTMCIKEGSPLEIKINENGEIVLCKHNLLASVEDYAQDFCEVASAILNLPVLICDKEKIIALSGCSKKMYLSKPLSDQISKLIDNCSNYIANTLQGTNIIKIIADDEDAYVSQVIFPISSNLSCEGMVICTSVSGIIDVEKCNIVKLIASYLSKQIG